MSLSHENHTFKKYIYRYYTNKIFSFLIKQNEPVSTVNINITDRCGTLCATLYKENIDFNFTQYSLSKLFMLLESKVIQMS